MWSRSVIQSVNSACGPSSVIQSVNSACGPSSVIQSVNSACGPSSVIQCVNSACGPGSVIQCVNSACGPMFCYTALTPRFMLYSAVNSAFSEIRILLYSLYNSVRCDPASVSSVIYRILC